MVLCQEEQENRELSDKEAWEVIKDICRVINAAEFQNMDAAKRENSVALLKKSGLSKRQISRLTGISFWIVRKL